MPVNPYESDRLLGEYLLFHYGRPEEVMPYAFGPLGALDFAVRVVNECVDAAALPPDARALDLGCAVGRSSFELARHCWEVVGIDFSSRFVEAADTLRVQGRLPYRHTTEGKITSACEAVVPAEIDRSRVSFEVGDACDLRADLGNFDVVLLINLVDRLREPRRCLERLPGLVRPGGQLVIASPFTWMEEYTPPENWLGGYYAPGGHPVNGMETLRGSLAPDFDFVRTVEVPFLIREHVRKFQWSVSLAGVWRRR